MKHEKILKTYKRNHQGENFEENERSKIKREKVVAKRIERQSEELMKDITKMEDYDQLLDRYDEMSYQAKKVTGNKNTHKKRLKELVKNKEFE